MSISTRSVRQKTGRLLATVPWWMWVITAVAVVARLATAAHGLPYELDPDENIIVDAAWRMIDTGSLDPGWYNHPAATLMDALAALYTTYGLVGVGTGSFDTVSGAGTAYWADVTDFFLIGRLVSVVSGVGVVLLTYAVLRELRSSTYWAAVAALLVALSFPMVQFSSLVRADMLMIVFLLATLLVTLRAMDRPSGRAFVLAGALMGLAATSKYPGALGAVPILVANITLVVEERITPRRGLIWLAAAAAAAVAIAFVAAPYLFVNFGETLIAIKSEAAPEKLGATGAGPMHNLWAYLTAALPVALGPVATAIGVVGLLVMLIHRRPRVAALTFWGFLAFLSILSLWWLRWVLPLVPFVAIGAAVVIHQVEARVRGGRPGPWLPAARVATALVLVLPLVGPAVAGVWSHATNDDTRMRAIEWIHENVPEESTLLIDSYTTQVSSDRYDVLVAQDGELVRWSDSQPKLRPDGWFDMTAGEWYGTPSELLEAIKAEQVDYVVLTDLWIDLFRAESDTYPLQLAIYESLLSAFPVAAAFDADDARLGWPIKILRASDEAPASQSNGPAGE